MTRASLLFLAACGASTPPPPSPTSEPVTQAKTVCAARYADMPGLSSCAGFEGTTCDFPEGSCSCGPQSYCGGVAPSQELLAELDKPVWQCVTLRTDGCPEDLPSGPCDTEQKSCMYGDCCVQEVTCIGGTWAEREKICPP